ncbi:oligosaccharide amylase [Paenibacillus phyllosphaerae]|uniref:Oligosaccharide amylase n=1 Tax=Paenibacillus phyllosphaerae TaxID=274593 RepID=A0A7W5AXM1_9BACL|nr:glycoside hydrolase family 15 protein [Paenibacillus phyllosphaerae]MBB3110633.1 oligosaccharide amylase [Paenibacillus phyllosphaerae]
MLNDKPYLIDAITGNSRFLASLGNTGRMYRLWWPNIDFPQHVDKIHSGLFFEGELASGRTSWFDEPEHGWSHEAAYVPGTNIFRTKAKHHYFPVEATTVDFAAPGEDFHVREYTFTNNGESPVSFQFLFYSAFAIAENRLYNTVFFDEEADAIVHYRHRYFFSIGSSNVCTGYQAGYAWDAAENGALRGTNIEMTTDGGLSWKIQDLAPGAAVTVPVYIAAGTTRFESLDALNKAKSRPSNEWFAETNQYWHEFVEAATPCPTDNPEIKELYVRSLLMFKLMSDEKTGSIVAAPEFDENFSRCGGYSYCWGRDAAFITTAIDKAGLTGLTDRFYDWALTAQDPDGSWQQRHYHDGSLAPSWGIQLDEGASLIWGMWEHYKHTGSRDFAVRVWPSVEKGAAFLVASLDPATGLPKPSRDLWEEREAEHTYSAAAVYGGLSAAASFAELEGKQELAAEWSAAAARVQEGLAAHGWNEEKDSFYRGLKITVYPHVYEEATSKGLQGYTQTSAKGYTTYHLQHDPVIDISLLGISVPFGAFTPDDERMVKTADVVERELTSPIVGGIKRYEDDTYAGGNPWILTTLWLAHYRIANGQYDEAKKHLQWAIDHRTATGLLPEQVDKNTGETAWVVPLTWSHAMFVLTIFMLAERGELN